MEACVHMIIIFIHRILIISPSKGCLQIQLRLDNKRRSFSENNFCGSNTLNFGLSNFV